MRPHWYGVLWSVGALIFIAALGLDFWQGMFALVGLIIMDEVNDAIHRD